MEATHSRGASTAGGLGVALSDEGEIAVGLTFAGGAPADGLLLVTPPGP